MTNAPLMNRTTEEHIGNDERVFEMLCTLFDSTEIKMMPNHYCRA